MSNEGFKDRRRRLSSSSDEDFMKLSDGIPYKDQETYKSEEEKKPQRFEIKKKPSNFQYQKPRRGKGRGANNNWRREDNPKPKTNEKPQTHYRKKVVPKYDLNAQEFQPSGFNANATDFVSFSQVPSGFNPSAQEFNPQFGINAPEFNPNFS